MKRYLLNSCSSRLIVLSALLLGLSSCNQQTSLSRNSGKIRGNERDQNQNANPGNNGGGGNGGVLRAPFKLPLIPSDTRIRDDFQPFFDESSIIQQDLNRLQRENANLVPRTRYITFTFLNYLDISDQEKIRLKTDMINSASATINSVSTNNVISRPEPIDDQFTVFRIDIDDYEIGFGEWNQLTAGYPYRNSFNDQFADVAIRIGTANDPIVRGDWLSFQSMSAGRYANTLGLPGNIANLENAGIINVNRAANIQEAFENRGQGSDRISRVGIAGGQSGKSINNRILERHQGTTGPYWVSYDFAQQNGDARRNFVNSPIGPQGIVNDIGDIDAFDPDGQQAIFTLPNGLMGFYLTNANGNLIAESDDDVVFDKNGGKNGPEIRLGFSCMKCHGGGKIVRAQDSLRNIIQQLDNGDIPDIVIDGTLALHREQRDLDRLFDQDGTRFQNAFNNTKIIRQGQGGNFMQAALYYDGQVSFDRIASELNITPAQLERAADNIRNDNLRLEILSAKASGLDRQTFEQRFDDLLFALFEERQ